MNGWQRLFTLGVITTGLGCAALGITVAWPSRTVYVGCGLENGYVSQERAIGWAKVGEIPAAEWASYQTTSPLDDPGCFKEIVDIGNGDRYRTDMRSFAGNVGIGTVVFICFWAVIYALGWGLGWVWRGFFPRKTSA